MKGTKALVKKVIAMMVLVIMVFQCGLGAVGVAAVESGAGNESKNYDMTPAITDIVIQAQVDEENDEWYTIPQVYNENMPEIDKDAKVKVAILYDPGKLTNAFKTGDIISYQLPSGITTINTQKGDVYDGPTVVGKYEINGKNIKITLTNESYLDSSDGKLKNGAISFEGNFDGNAWGEGGKQEIEFGKISLTVKFEKEEVHKAEVNVKKEIVNLKDKKIQADTKYIEYKITVSTPSDNTQDMKNVVVEDSFTSGSSYVASMTAVSAPTKGSFDSAKKVWTIGTMAPGETQVLVVRANLNGNIFAGGTTVGDRTITNKATVKATDATTRVSTVEAKANSGLNIAKTNGTYTFDKDKGKAQLTYTVTVTAPSTNKWAITNVSVYDYFSDNKAYVVKYDSINAPTGTSCTTKVQTTGSKEKSLTWNIGTMNPGDKKVLTYTVDIDQTIFLGSGNHITRYLKNSAQLKVNGSNKKTVSTTEKFSKEWLSKSGTVQPDGRIKFTVQGNKGTLMLNGDLTFSDTLTGNWVFDGDVVGIKYSLDANGKYTEVGRISVPADGEKAWTKVVDGGHYYVFTYYARYVGDKIGATDISNKAGVGIGVGGKQYTHYYTWEGTGNEYKSLTKEFIEREGNIAKWESKIIANIPADAFYIDYRDSDHEWTLTDDQIAAVVVKKGSQELVAGTKESGADYSIERVDSSSFKITFHKAISNVSEDSPVTITYDTTLTTNDLDPGESAKYVNKAIIETLKGDKDTADAECSFLQEQRMTKTAGAYNRDNTELTWLITVNNTGSLNDEATLRDILPTGLKFVDAKITARGAKAANTNIVEKRTDGNSVIIELDGLVQSYDKNAYVTIEVRTKIVDTDFLLGNNVEKTYNNKAELDYEGTITESYAQQTITNNSLTKTGVYNQDTAPNIEYEIKVNPEGLDMLDNAETIRIEDTMLSNMMLRSETLKVVDKTGAEVEIVDLKIEKNVFSFDVPDDKALTITYKAYVSGEVGDEVDTENTVAYYGMADIPGQKVEKRVVIAKSRASIEGAVGFYIFKKDAHDIYRALEGTEYTLYKMGSDEVIVSTADAAGKVSFVGLDETAVYAFKETKAVDEYIIDDTNKELYYVAFNKQAAENAQVPDGVEVNVIQSSIGLERYNEYNSKTSIVFSGVKTLSNANYDLTEDMYEFTIAGPNLQNGVQTIGHDAEGNIEFPEIHYELKDLNGESSKTYEYTIKENKGSKKGIEYSSDIYNVKVTVTKNNNGTINAAVTEVKKNGNPIEERTFDFVNTYNAKDVTTTVAGLKNTENIDLNAGDYTFQLRETTADAATPYTATAENDANGYFSFQLPTYTLADHGKTFTYEVSEVKGDKPGMTYDETVYTVNITITDMLNGELSLNKVITAGDKTTDQISFTNRFDGSVELTKSNGKDGDEYKTLAGAGFKLYKDGNLYRDNLITDGDGKLFVENLPVGSYYFVETKAPVGYDIITDAEGNPRKYNFEIGPDEGKAVVDAKVEVANEQRLGKLSLVKSDVETKAKIQGAVFTLYKDNAIFEEGLTTDVNGMITMSDLPWGEYYFVETAAPDGYIVDTTPTETVKIDAFYVEDNPVTVEKTNKFEGSASLTKTNGKTDEAKEVLSGAVFSLYKVGEQEDILVADNLTTGEDGKVSVGGLSEATYYFVETTPPAGYDIVTDEGGNPLKYEFKIGPNGGDEEVNEHIEIDNRQKLGTLALEKSDIDTKALIKGVEFALYKNGELYKDDLFTDENGIVEVDNLPWADYYFVEVSAPNGYIVDATPTETVPVNAAYVDGDVKTLPKTNKFEGSVELTKTNGKDGEAYEVLSGAVFDLYKDDVLYKSGLKTGEDGKISVDGLAEASYYFVETTPPAGYSIVTDEQGMALKYEFKIGPNGGEAVVDEIIEIANEQKLGTLSLIKKDVDSAALIEGAEFELYKDGELYQTGLITDAEGKITVTDLPWGDYYFVETVPAPGYIYDATPTETITVDAAYVDGEPATVEKTNKQTELYITKTDISGENLVSGSFIEIFKMSRARGELEEEPVVSWLSDGTNHLIKGELSIGETYILKETKAPVGYGYISSYVEFYVNADGTIETAANYAIDENGNKVFLVQDDIIDLKVSKVDFETEKVLEGAVLAIYDKETGEEMERWTSDEDGHYDFGKSLHANKTYVLKELKAPEGYNKIEDVEFSVLNEGQIDIITKTKFVKYEDGHMSVYNCKVEEVDTGDQTPLGMGMILMTLAMIGMVSVGLAPRRRED